MQTEQTKAEKAPKPKKEEPKKEETRDEKKARLLAIPDHKRTKKDSLTLVAIAQEEEAERHHGALIHRLTERADKWGRKQINLVKRQVTDGVAKVSKVESAKLQAERASHKDRRENVKKEAQLAMKQLQEKLNKDLKKLDDEHEGRMREIREAHKAEYDKAAQEIEDRTSEISNQVGGFTQVLPDLTTEQLEELTKDGTTLVGEEAIAVPDAAAQPAPA